MKIDRQPGESKHERATRKALMEEAQRIFATIDGPFSGQWWRPVVEDGQVEVVLR